MEVTTHQYKVLLIDHPYPTMKDFYSDDSAPSDNVLIHRAQGFNEWFDEVENYIKIICYSLHNKQI